MKKFIAMLVLLTLALVGNVYADAQNEAETKPRKLTVTSWVPASAANQSCVTTCGIATPIFAIDATTALFVTTSNATADSCVCNGAVS